jgi:signal transduction histidine kinase
MALMRINRSIGAKIFGAFIAMGLITGLLGLYGLYVLSAAGGFVVDTFDKPLMAINFARSASLTFTRMDKEVLRRTLTPPAEQPAIDAGLALLNSSFFEDLAVVADRSPAGDERKIVQQIKDLVAAWNGLISATDEDTRRRRNALSDQIIERFDVLIELTTDHSYVARRRAITAIHEFTYTSIAATVAALLLSAAITFFLARRIIRPLAAAAVAADRIADGEFETPLPRGTEDETGILLRSMTVMQDNIRAMVEREKAQRRSAQSRLIDALESSHEGMLLVDAEGQVAIANSQLYAFFPPLRRLLARDADFDRGLAGIDDLLMPIGDADRPSTAAESWHDRLRDGGEFQLADGRWIRVGRSSTQDGGILFVLSDYTDVKEREERLTDAKRAAEAASAAKSNFLANMSHELRTPLNAIIGFSEIIAVQMFGPVANPKYVEYAGNILDSGRHLLDVINSVLDLSRSQAGKLQLNAEMVDLHAIFEDCVTIMHDQCARASLDLRVAMPDAALDVWGDPAKLRQIILNLLSNAVKFTEPGGKVTVDASPAENDMVRLCIADTGIGMAAEDIPLALAPFGQIDSRLARRYEGTGLGLPLTKAFVDLHNGRLEIDSALGRGTRIVVLLPTRPPEEATLSAIDGIDEIEPQTARA